MSCGHECILIEGYALGWRCNEDDETQQLAEQIGGGDVICRHDGSVTFAKMYIVPGRDRAFIATTNDIRATDLVYGVEEMFLNQTDEYIEMFLYYCSPIDEVKASGSKPTPTEAPTTGSSSTRHLCNLSHRPLSLFRCLLC